MAEEDASKEAEVKAKEIKEAGAKNGEQVVDSLIKAVVTVRAEPPQRLVASSS